MSGIEVIRSASPFLPDTFWVIISGFADFEASQQAVHLQRDYTADASS